MTDFKTIEDIILELMGKEDRKDVEFRYAIAVTEIGDLGKYITHDPALNPNARPHGSREDEALAYGQAFVQLAALAFLRGISLEEAIGKGIENWQQSDWRKVKAKEGSEIKGIVACPGYVVGNAYVANSSGMIDMPSGSVLVTEFAKPDLVEYLKSASAVVTDHGGKTCHLASIARQFGIPCIVGTGNATSRIKTGQIVEVDATGEIGIIKAKYSGRHNF